MTKAATLEDIEAICRSYEQGNSSHKIAQMTGRTSTGIRNILLKRGYTFSRPGELQPLRKMTTEVTAHAAVLYRNGLSLRDISEQVGVSAVAIRRALMKTGQLLRSHERPRDGSWGKVEDKTGKLYCSECKELKDPDHFANNKNRAGTLRSQKSYLCKDCERWRTRARTYKVSRLEYQAKQEAQAGLCAICRLPWTGNKMNPDLVVDHNHTTGQIRDLLCPSCNHVLGHAKENPATLKAAADYLERHALLAKQP